uniref:Uncharacterized protein n=1 Tax=Lactuca sativa TaxID=4236 RepID=A0A9R1UMC3_LACSA|nr:hypothetical protein LSAT_V11C800430630 [Lactuca sativa]
MNNFLGASSSSLSDEDDSNNDELIMHILFSTAYNIVRQRDDSSNIEKSINRDRIASNELLLHDYFPSDRLYNLSKFKDRFHISRKLFVRIDARGKRGLLHFKNAQQLLKNWHTT